MCNIQQIWLRIFRVHLSNRIYTKKIHFFKKPPKHWKFLQFPLRKAAINATLTAYAKQTISLNKNPNQMYFVFKILKILFTLFRSTCFGHHCVHHQELLSCTCSLLSLSVIRIHVFL